VWTPGGASLLGSLGGVYPAKNLNHSCAPQTASIAKQDQHLGCCSPGARAGPFTYSCVSVVGGETVGGAKHHAAPRECRSKRRRAKRDKRRKTLSKGITSRERRDVLRADGFAGVIRRPLNTTFDFHPCRLDIYPTAALGTFFSDLRMRISTWLRRTRIGTYWVWTRENYEGDRREHLHIVMHLPPRFRAELEDHVRGLFPGGPDLVGIGERVNVRNPKTGRWDDGLRYRMKQLRGDAVGAPGPTRLNRETRSRRDGSPVAPVFGKRCGVSDTLTLKAERKWFGAE
jgi:hypothetical protein